jgi:Leucine-rich repeat (LRR) protein
MKRLFPFLILMASVAQGALAQSRFQDSLALVDLYNATGGANWRDRTNWLSANPMDTWSGIILDAQGRVQRIYLQSNQMIGSIPNLSLSNLTHLTLGVNQLSGSIPNFNLPNLQQLALYQNQLSGSIPNFNLPNLISLELSINQLSGSIPNFNLPNLSSLNLSSNQLSGSIPNFNSVSPWIWSIGLSHNQLSGNIPNFNLPNLEYLHLNNNQLSGSIPNFNFSILRRFNFYSNKIDSIPNLSGLMALATFKADTNKITFDDILPNLARGMTYTQQDSIFTETTYSKYTGDALTINLGIDAAITSNVYKWYKNGALYQTNTGNNKLIFNNLALTDAGIYTCQVTNPNAPLLTLYSRKATLNVALSCRTSDSLVLVDLYNATGGANWTNRTNWLSNNPISTWYGIITNAQGCVTCIDLDGDADCQAYQPPGNHLAGALPSTLNNLSNLEYLHLSRNQLTGSIPNFNLPNLQILYLERNQLTGSIPNFNLPNLITLSLDENQLTSSIPNFNLPNLRGIQLAYNQLSGSIPNFNLPNLVSLYLKNNQLSGSIPNFNLPNLLYLELDDNQLSGSIPNFNLPNLQSVWLNGNQLNGSIPNFNLPNLKYLWLSDNQLNGSIPNFNLPNLINLGLANNQLNGSIPTFNLPNLQILHLGSNQLSSSIPNFNFINLYRLNLEENQLSGSIPNFNFPNLQYLQIYSNKIDSIPNLSALTNLNNGVFSAYSNRITFDDILPNVARGMSYTPQDSIFTETTYSKYTGDALTINLGIDAAITSNVYKWYKNGALYQTNTGNNKLIFNNLALTDAGIYTCQVTNPNAPLLTLYSRKATLNVALSCRTSDSLALVDLYNATGGANWTNRTNWLSNNPINTWHGVTTNAEGCVITIRLQRNQLTGNIPNFNLPNLQELRLTYNQLTGIPNFNLPNLSILGLNSNQLSGTIPNFNLPNLQHLWLFSNRLSGSIPNFNLPNLQSLNLYNNELSGSIPNFNLPNAVNIRLDFNQLSGNIPNFNLPNLQNLDLASNQLSGNIPNFNLPNLQVLRLFENQLSGSIPNFNLPNLQELSINVNQLSGSIPNFNLLNLQDLRLTENQLSGNIPNFNLPNLRILLLYSNQLSGNIPNFNLPNLQALYLQTNQLSGNIPNFNLLNLQGLRLTSNQLSGSIPNFNLPNLIGVYLDSNQLTGNIPNFNLPNLKYLSLNVNQLSSSTPIFNLPNLNQFHCHSNKIDSMPNLSHLPLRNFFDNGSDIEILGLHSHRNKLTFDDILPNMGFVTSANFIYTPQDSIYVDTTIAKYIGNSLTVNLGIDGALTSNKYKWYKNGVLFDSTTVNQLIINNLQTTHAGIYTCQVTNPNAPLLTLYSRKITLQVTCPPTRDSTLSATLCTGRVYPLPSGRTVNATGTYPDTVRSRVNPTCDSLRFTVTLTNDVSCRCSDSLQLVTLYNATGGANWTNRTNWLSNNPISTWYGITTNAQGCVTCIDLDGDANCHLAQGSGNGLRGNLPNLNIPTLTFLSLANNALTGTVPNFNLPNLVRLALQNNQLSGNIPNFALPSLVTLYLHQNQLTGNIPNFNLANLAFLWLDANRLTGNLPDLSATNLTQLLLNDNQLTGSIPNFNFSQLQTLHLSNNQLTGNIPTFNLPNLSVLNLSNNQLSGTIPTLNLPKLSDFRIHHNQLTGIIPNFRADSLRYFRFYKNQLDSVSVLTGFTRLSVCVGDTNRLTFDDILPNLVRGMTYTKQDSIFTETTYSRNAGQSVTIDLGIDAAIATNVYKWFKNGALYQTINGSNQLIFNSLAIADAGTYTCQVTNPNAPLLTLYSRKATINVTSPCRAQDSLALVDLYNATNGANWTNRTNWLSANPIQTWYGVYVNATGCVDSIGLVANRLTGTLPNLSLSNLQGLMLSGNQLSGSIPNLNLPNLKYLGINHNQFNGPIPPFNLPKLTQLWLHNNQLIGSIPNFNLPQLKSLYLQANQLSGTMPQLGSPNLTTLWFYKNLIDSVSNLSSLTTLTAVQADTNRLTFDDILPNLARGITYTKQDSIFKDTTFAKNAGQPLVIHLGMDGALTTNVYKWFKNGSLYQTTSVNQLIFNCLQPSDAGLYTCQVTNPNAPLLTLQSRKITVTVATANQNQPIQAKICKGATYTMPRGRAVNLSGTHYDTFRFPTRCDSIVTIYLSVVKPDTTRLRDSVVCFAVDTQTRVRRFQNTAGCDSTVFQRLRLAQRDTVINTQIVCDTVAERTDTSFTRIQNRCEEITITHYTFKRCECLKETQIYNALIPNDNDDKNNVFWIHNLERFSPNELIITDKRNTLLYRIQNYNNDWTGTDQNGVPLPAGVYNYWFKMKHPITGQQCTRVGVIDLKYIP